MDVKLHFFGAAGVVTGSCMMLEYGANAVLVDCGMFQGTKSLKQLNYNALPFDVAKISAVLLTHAHIDHSGMLPKLTRAGYKGPIFATPGTKDLCGVMLADAGGIQEMEVQQLNRRNRQQNAAEVQPIYTRKDADACMQHFRTTPLKTWTAAAPGLRAQWWNAGHILGAGSIEVEVAGDAGVAPLRLLFSGDLGAGGSQFERDPEGPTGLDYVVMESTYGGTARARLTPDQRRALLVKEMLAAHTAGGPLLIPAFAVERTQEIVVDLLQAMDSGEAPRGPIFVDSPLAISAMETFHRYGQAQDGSNPFAALRESQWLQFTELASESIALERVKGWHVIVASSGMCDAGRVRHHLKRLLWRNQATVMLVGYQAVGTLGRLLRDGVKDVRIQGEQIHVNARIRSLDIYSGHADGPTLVKWAQARAPIAGNIFLTHGEPESSDDLRQKLIAADIVGDRVVAAELDQCFRLATGQPATLGASTPRMPPRSVAQHDWHNERADFLNKLDARLGRAKDDGERKGVIAAAKAALN